MKNKSGVELKKCPKCKSVFVATFNHACRGEKSDPPQCVHLGDKTGNVIECDSCGTNADGTKKKTRFFTYHCSIFQTCIFSTKIPAIQQCGPKCVAYKATDVV